MDYRRLKGKIEEVFGTRANFAKALGIHPSTLSAKLNEKSIWKSKEIDKACELLNIPLVEAHLYFFTLKV